VKASKAAARDERRVARNQRQRGRQTNVADDFAANAVENANASTESDPGGPE